MVRFSATGAIAADALLLAFLVLFAIGAGVYCALAMAFDWFCDEVEHNLTEDRT